jgi:hypothetical protein
MRCRVDCVYFIENYVKIEDKDGIEVAIPFTLWDEQKEALNLILNEKLVQFLKARQLGATWLALAYCVWGMKFKHGFSALAISKTDKDAGELVRRVKFILRHLPTWMFDIGEVFDGNVSTVKISRRDGESSIFDSFPASEGSGRSFTGNVVILDEWAFQQWAEEIWKSIFPSVNRPTGGKVIGISTIERGSLFEKMWLDENNGFRKIFLPWYVDKRRDKAWYENTKNAIGQDAMYSEYPATVEEALSVAGGAFFDEFNTTIHLQEEEQIFPWYTKYCTMDYGMDAFACYFIYIDAKGFSRIYKEIHKSGLVISSAAYELLRESGASVPKTVEEWDILNSDEKREIAQTAKERFVCIYAPPDLFSKSSQTGKASSDVWYENGILLTRTKNDREEGCIAMKEWLHPITLKNEQTGKDFLTSRLTINGKSAKLCCAPYLVNSLLKIQKDKQNPKVYAKNPHGITHSVDGVRYFCTEYNMTATVPEIEKVITEENYIYEYVFPLHHEKFKKLTKKNRRYNLN